MDREFFLRLVFATFRVVHALPEGEEIRYRMKDSLGQIASDFFLLGEEEFLEKDDREKVRSRLEQEVLAFLDRIGYVKAQHWIEPDNFLVLEKEYQKLAESLQQSQETKKPLEGEVVVARRERSSQGSQKQERRGLSERQKKILGVLKDQQRAQVWELQKVLPEVTKRTLRRDLDELLRLNLVERQGEWNEVFYRLKQPASSYS